MLQAVARPRSLREARSILGKHDRAVIIAGGTVVMPRLNYGTDDFDTLVSLRRSRLSGIAVKAGRVTIGALAQFRQADENHPGNWPLSLGQALPEYALGGLGDGPAHAA